MKNIKKNLILCTLFLTSCFIYQKGSPDWIKNWGIDPATYLFFSLVPILWLLKISWKTNGFIAIIFLILMMVFSLNKSDQTAENFAILAFFFFALAVFQQIKELVQTKNSYGIHN